jgi:hypothetical protein
VEVAPNELLFAVAICYSMSVSSIISTVTRQ